MKVVVQTRPGLSQAREVAYGCTKSAIPAKAPLEGVFAFLEDIKVSDTFIFTMKKMNKV